MKEVKPVQLKDCVGKIIKDVFFADYDEKALIEFEDGEYAMLGISRGHFEDDAELVHETEIDVFKFGESELLRAGILEPGELDKLKKEAKEKKEIEEKADLEEYEDHQLKIFQQKIAARQTTKRMSKPKPTGEGGTESGSQ